MNKKLLFSILKYILIFLLVIGFNQITLLYCDEVWSYGFSYGVSKGLLPYRDFSTIVPPFFCFLYSIPLIIFGNSNLAFNIFNGLLVVIMFYFMEKMINKKVYL